MATALRFLMVKRAKNKGFTLIECLLVITIISLISVITISVCHKITISRKAESIINDLGYLQFQAIMNNEKMEYENDEIANYISFNRLGNANKAQSIYYSHWTIIVSLGTGRIYEKE